MRPHSRGADTRNKILDVAEQDFARSGFAGAHLQHIAEQVGVQKTALYYYYPSKAALYEAVLVRMLEAFDQAVSKAIDGPESPAGRLERLFRRSGADRWGGVATADRAGRGKAARLLP
jgi:TetR/AcrR family transcriptional regulator